MKIGDQLAGDFGPRFVGYAQPPKPVLMQRARAAAVLAALIAGCALAVEAAAGKI